VNFGNKSGIEMNEGGSQGEASSLQEADAARKQVKPSSMQAPLSDDPVGTALRRLHDDVIAEPLPDDFLRLLGDIERKIAGQAGDE
jgi:hypothetical protein